jgi:hypothetical protein
MDHSVGFKYTIRLRRNGTKFIVEVVGEWRRFIRLAFVVRSKEIVAGHMMPIWRECSSGDSRLPKFFSKEKFISFRII